MGGAEGEGGLPDLSSDASVDEDTPPNKCFEMIVCTAASSSSIDRARSNNKMPQTHQPRAPMVRAI